MTIELKMNDEGETEYWQIAFAQVFAFMEPLKKTNRYL